MEQSSEISIKGMVCDRCKSVINQGITNLGYPVIQVALGKIRISSSLQENDLMRISNFLKEQGFELLADKKEKLVKKVKEIIEEIFDENGKYDSKIKFSILLAEQLNMNYDSISEIFAKFETTTIEKYLITRRLEKVKELLAYTNLSLTEIAYRTGFNSINHLSRQFKEMTGLPPSYFKSIGLARKLQ